MLTRTLWSALTDIAIGSLTSSAPAAMVTDFWWEKVTVRCDPATAVAWSACAAMLTAPTASGMVLRRLDTWMRSDVPATVECATIRMVWSLKFGPPMVMLGDHADTRWVLVAWALVAWALAAWAVADWPAPPMS